MKKLLYIICLVILSCNLNSCDFFGQHEVEDAPLYGGQAGQSESNKSDKGQNDSIEKVQDQAQEQARIAFEEKKISELETNFLAYKDSVNKIQTELGLLKTDSEKKLGNRSAYVLMIIEFFLLLGCLVYLLSKIKSLEKWFNERLNSNAQSDKPKTNNNLLGRQTQANEREIGELRRDINTLKKRIEALEKKLVENRSYDNQTVKGDPIVKEADANDTNPTEISQMPEEQVKPSQPTNPRVFYMPRTSEQNRFDDDKKKYVPDDSSYFKFTLKSSSSDKADFVIDVDDSHKVRKSWDARNETILTVCEITSSVSDPKGCRNVIPGEAELRGNIWYVTKKAKIVYY